MAKASMDLQSKWLALRQKHEQTKFRFVNVELDLAITYCLVAMAATDRARACRNLANAERAYCVAACFLNGGLNAEQNRAIKTKLVRFRSLRVNCDDIQIQ